MEYILYLLIVMSLAACNKSDNNINSNKIDFAELNSDNILKLSELYDSISYVKLETTHESLIGTIKKIIPYKDNFIIFDNKYSNIFVFDAVGKFIKRIGDKGTGPNEYIKVDDICFDQTKNRLFVLDNTRGRIQVFDDNGKVLYNVKLTFMPNEIEYLSGMIICYNDFKTNDNLKTGNKYPLVTLIDAENGEILSSHMYFSSKIQSKEIISPYSATSTDGTSVCIFNLLTSSITVFNKKEGIEEYVLNFGTEDTKTREKYYLKLQEKQLDAYDVCSGCKHQPDYTMITSVLKEKSNFYISAINYVEKKQYFIKYNIDTKDCIYARTNRISPFVNDIDNGMPLLIQKSIENGKSYGYIDALSVCYNIGDKKDFRSTELKRIIENTKEEDNPIIFIAKLKL